MHIGTISKTLKLYVSIILHVRFLYQILSGEFQERHWRGAESQRRVNGGVERGIQELGQDVVRTLVTLP